MRVPPPLLGAICCVLVRNRIRIARRIWQALPKLVHVEAFMVERSCQGLLVTERVPRQVDCAVGSRDTLVTDVTAPNPDVHVTNVHTIPTCNIPHGAEVHRQGRTARSSLA